MAGALGAAATCPIGGCQCLIGERAQIASPGRTFYDNRDWADAYGDWLKMTNEKP